MRVLFPLPVKMTCPGSVRQRSCRGQANDLAHACSGVIQQDEQHPIPAGFRRLTGERGKDRPCLGFGEVLDGRLGVNRGLEGLGCLAERDEGDVFMGCVRQKRFNRAQTQRDGLGRVVPLIGHPGPPSFQVLAIEVVETDAVAFDMLVVGEVAQEALQADPVRLNRFRRESPGLGHVGVQVVTGEAEEFRGVGARVSSHSNPTSGSNDWLFRVIWA